MTFIIFLVSRAVLECVLRRSGAGASARAQSKEGDQKAMDEQPAASDLQQLGKVLDDYPEEAAKPEPEEAAKSPGATTG